MVGKLQAGFASHQALMRLMMTTGRQTTIKQKTLSFPNLTAPDDALRRVVLCGATQADGSTLSIP